MDNSKCEYEIIKQHIEHWMPCDEPVDSIQKLFSNNIHLFFFVDNRKFNNESR